MLGKGTGVAIACVAILAGFAPSAAARGGNHGCNEAERSFYEDHFFESGDNVVAGYVDVVPEPLRAAPRGIIRNPTEELTKTTNTEDGGPTNTQVCVSQSDHFWTLFISRVGPGDDSVRMNAAGLDDKNDYEPLPRWIASLVKGGTGDDDLRGHVGFDDLSGGGGADLLKPGKGRDSTKGGGGDDLIKTAGGGSDSVTCGGGEDKAVVDKRDDVRGCERVRVR